MAATTALSGFGVRLQRGTTDIGELIELSGPNIKRNMIAASHTLSPNQWEEFIAGMKNGGEISATIALVPSATQTQPHQELFDDLNNTAKVAYRILFPDANVYLSFDAFVSGLDHATPIDARMTLAVTLTVTGAVTLAALS